MPSTFSLFICCVAFCFAFLLDGGRCFAFGENKAPAFVRPNVQDVCNIMRRSGELSQAVSNRLNFCPSGCSSVDSWPNQFEWQGKKDPARYPPLSNIFYNPQNRAAKATFWASSLPTHPCYHPKDDANDEQHTVLLEDIEPPKKILLMVEPTPFTWISGYATRYKEFLNFLSLQNSTVLILTTDSGKKRPSKAFGFPIVYTHGYSIPLYKKEGYTLSADVPQFKGWGLIRKFEPHLLHVSSPGLLSLTATFIYSKLLKVPLVLAYHTHLPAYASKYIRWLPGISKLVWLLIKWIHNHADLTLVSSHQLKNEMVEWRINNVNVWQKGIDTERFHPNKKSFSMRMKLTGGFPDSILLLSVGRLGIEKDLSVLREVVSHLPDVRLAFVGTGPIEDQLKEEFAGTHTIFVGALQGEDLAAAFASADIFCMPSTTETLGFVVLEAMASGIPVVGSRSGGLINLIHDGKTGFLVDPLNAVAFTDKVKELIHNQELRVKMGKEARYEAEQWGWTESMLKLRNYQYRLAIQSYLERSKNSSWLNRCLKKIVSRWNVGK